MGKAPPIEVTLAALRNARPFGEYSRVETEKRQRTRMLQKVIDNVFRQPDEVRQVRQSSFWSPPQRKRKKPAQKGGVMLQSYLGKPCGYCERPMLGDRYPTRDHKHPRRLGGKLTASNLLIVCRACNGEKGGKTVEQFAQELTNRGDKRAAIVWRHASAAPSV